jgi:Lrp/AsnC family leucine-responsive transcriptional regulator
VLLVAVPDMPGLQALLDRLADYGRPESSLVLDDVVEWGVITAADSPGAS